MRTILVTSPHVPREWIEAHGFMPRRSVPMLELAEGDVPPAQGMCHYMWRSVLETNMREDAVATIFTTICDQMRRAPEYCRRPQGSMFLFHVPKAWSEPAAFEYYLSELQRLSVFLCQLGGRAPAGDELMEVMFSSEQKRQSLLELKSRLSARQLSELLMRFHSDGTIDPGSCPVKSDKGSIPVAMIGGPLTKDDYSLFDEVEKAGGRIVIDGTENGERTLPSRFDPSMTRIAPLRELGRAYFMGIPDVFRRPNDALFEWLKNVTTSHSVRGIILVRQLWCDLWHAEVYRIREMSRLPVLDIDSDGRSIVGRNRTRIEAFMELLR